MKESAKTTHAIDWEKAAELIIAETAADRIDPHPVYDVDTRCINAIYHHFGGSWPRAKAVYWALKGKEYEERKRLSINWSWRTRTGHRQ